MGRLDLLTKGMALEIAVAAKEVTDLDALKEVYDCFNMITVSIKSRIEELSNKPSPNQLTMLTEDEES